MTDPHSNEAMVLHDAPPAFGVTADGDIDLSLLKDSLAKTPWERMQGER